jgi:outer membrane protein assembly factor BamB
MNRSTSALLLIVCLGFSKEILANSTPRLFTRWVESLQNPKNAVDQIEQFFLGGLSEVEDSAFYTSGPNSQVEKRSSKSGEIIWAAPLEAASQGNWTLTEDKVLGADVRGKIYAINRTSGSIDWFFESKGLFFSKPLVHDGISYWLNSLGVLIALRVSDGQWLWQYSESAATNFHLWAHQGPQMFSNVVLAGFPSGLLVAFDPKTGSRLWQESFAPSFEDTLALNEVRSISAQDSYLLASSYGGNTRLWKAAQGSKILVWEKRMSLQGSGTFDFEKSQVYVSDREGNLSAIDIETGFIKWTQFLDGGLGTQPQFGKQWVWVGSSTGRIFAFDREKGEPVGEPIIIGSSIYNPPLIFDDEAVVISSKGVIRRMFAFR